MGTEEMDEQQYEEADGQDGDFPVPVDVKRRAEANGEAVEEQVLPYRVPSVLEVTSYVPGLRSTTFWPLDIPLNDRREAAYKMLTRYGKGRGGFEPKNPVPSLWYADIKALRDGMQGRVQAYAEHYERWALKPVRKIIDGHRQKYKRKHGRMPPLKQQMRVNKVYRMVFEGKPWDEVKKYATDLLSKKRVERIRRHVRPDHFDEEKRSMMDYQCRNGLLREVRPTLLQLKAAEMALSSIATQRPIRDLPHDNGSPFAGTQKAYTYAQDMVDAYYDAIADPSLAMKGHSDLNTAIVSFTDHSPGAVREAMRRVGLRAGDDYEKRNVGDYVRAVEEMIKQHNRCT